jgi:polyisoprenoid-binding protein YceI
MTALATTTFTPGRWQHIEGRASARFAVRELGVKTVRGSVPVQMAWVDVDATGLPTQVYATLDLTAIDTGHRKRDADLQKPKLLDTAQYPTLAFSGGGPVPGPDGWQLTGELTGRAGACIPLLVQVETAPDGTVTVQATGSFDRQALGVRAPRFLIGRRIEVTIEAQFSCPTAS